MFLIYCILKDPILVRSVVFTKLLSFFKIRVAFTTKANLKRPDQSSSHAKKLISSSVSSNLGPEPGDKFRTLRYILCN